MGKYTIFYLLENPRRGMQARNFTTNVPKILDPKSSSEQIFFRKLSLAAPVKLMVYKATMQARLVKLYKAKLALSINLVPWVRSYPPYGGRVGANPWNEVDSLGMKIRLLLLFVNTING